MFRFVKTALFGLALTLGISGAAQAGGYGYGHYKPTYAPRHVPTYSAPKSYGHSYGHGYGYKSYAPSYKVVQVPVVIKVKTHTYGRYYG